MENSIKWDLILQNNGSKTEYAITGLTDSGTTSLFYEFKDLELDIPDGEYTYALIFNGRDDVEYEFSDVLLNTIVKTGEGNVKLKDLEPIMGLLIINPEARENKNIYIKKNKDYLYYEK